MSRMVIACAATVLASCTVVPPYYGPYDGYYVVAYGDPYYDAVVITGYYVPGTYYVYQLDERPAAGDAAPAVVRALLARWSATIDPECVSATRSRDGDRDGIDVSSTVTFDCSSSAGDGSTEVTGAVTLTDADDMAADAGFTLSFERFSVRVTKAGGAVTERVVDGTLGIRKGLADLRLTRDLTVEVVEVTETEADAAPRRTRMHLSGEGTFSPEAAPGGARTTRGTLTVSGQGTLTGPDGIGIDVTRATDPTLRWNVDCMNDAQHHGFDSGAIVYRAGGGRGPRVRLEYESCAKVTATSGT